MSNSMLMKRISTETTIWVVELATRLRESFVTIIPNISGDDTLTEAPPHTPRAASDTNYLKHVLGMFRVLRSDENDFFLARSCKGHAKVMQRSCKCEGKGVLNLL